VHRVDFRDLVHDQVDALGDEIALGLAAVLQGVDAEGHKKPARLVVVLPVPVDDGDLPLRLLQLLPDLGGHHGAPGSMPQNYQLFHSSRRPSFNLFYFLKIGLKPRESTQE
jgi:hypothetical protein